MKCVYSLVVVLVSLSCTVDVVHSIPTPDEVPCDPGFCLEMAPDGLPEIPTVGGGGGSLVVLNDPHTGDDEHQDEQEWNCIPLSEVSCHRSQAATNSRGECACVPIPTPTPKPRSSPKPTPVPCRIVEVDCMKTVTSAELCDTKLVACGMQTVTNAAQCGFKTSCNTVRILCGFRGFRPTFCNHNYNCRAVARTCTVPKTCVVPKTCDVLAKCEEEQCP